MRGVREFNAMLAKDSFKESMQTPQLALTTALHPHYAGLIHDTYRPMFVMSKVYTKQYTFHMTDKLSMHGSHIM